MTCIAGLLWGKSPITGAWMFLHKGKEWGHLVFVVAANQSFLCFETNFSDQTTWFKMACSSTWTRVALREFKNSPNQMNRILLYAGQSMQYFSPVLSKLLNPYLRVLSVGCIKFWDSSNIIRLILNLEHVLNITRVTATRYFRKLWLIVAQPHGDREQDQHWACQVMACCLTAPSHYHGSVLTNHQWSVLWNSPCRQFRKKCTKSLQWHHNERDGVSNHQRLDCLLNRLFKRRSKKISRLRVIGLCGGHRWIPHTKGQWRGNISIWWRHHDLSFDEFENHQFKVILDGRLVTCGEFDMKKKNGWYVL